MNATVREVSNWREAGDAVAEIANGLPIYYGSGNPIEHPHVCAITLDAWSGAGFGYSVHVHPHGDGYLQPVTVHTVYISR